MITINYIDSVNHLRFECIFCQGNLQISEAKTTNKSIYERTVFPNLFDFTGTTTIVSYEVYCKNYIDYTIYGAIDIIPDGEYDNYWLIFDNLYFALKYAMDQ